MQNTWGHEIIFPEDILYSPELLWVKKVDGDKLRLGLSHLAVLAAKRLISVDISSRKDTPLRKGGKIGTVENSKIRWEIKSPVSGEVVAINPEMFGRKATSLLVHDAYGEGWILELKKESGTESELKKLYGGDTEGGKEWLAVQTKAIIPLEDPEDYGED